MNPVEIAMANLYLILKAAATLFFIKFGLTIFGYSRFNWIVDMLILTALAGIIVSSLSGFMGSASSISHGVWPK